MKNILMIAAEYPPCLSAGVQRTYHFSENLLENGWMPHVLSAHQRIYRQIDQGINVSEPILQRLKRAFALDVTAHLAIKGKYIGWLENPDRFAAWYFMGWREGKKQVEQGNIDVIWSTFPVPTAHWIGYRVKQETGLPWVADYRDPLHYHVDESASTPSLALRIDRLTIEFADFVVFATHRMRKLYIDAYPHIDAEKFKVIENGYDQNLFDHLDKRTENRQQFQLLYSGGLYPQGRDPIPLFKAIASLSEQGVITRDSFQLVFRGSGNGDAYREKLRELNVESLVDFRESVPFADSIQEMKDADALLVLQGDIFNNQIPGKVYEYIATRNPILGLVGVSGATEQLLSEIDNAFVAGDSNVAAITRELKEMLRSARVNLVSTEKYSRRSRSKMLIGLLNELVP